MAQHPTTSETARVDTVQDETVRMRADGHGSRPAPEANPSHPAPEFPVPEFDDTRPVTRDWLLGAPESGGDGTDPATDPAGPVTAATATADDDWQTQAFDRAEPAAAAAVDEADATQTFDRAGERPAAPADDRLDGHPDDGSDTPAGPPPVDDSTGGPRGPWWRRKAVLVPAGAIAVLAAAYGADLLIASGDVPRNTVVAGIDIGGLSPAAASATLEE
jgi:hypothetical protein